MDEEGLRESFHKLLQEEKWKRFVKRRQVDNMKYLFVPSNTIGAGHHVRGLNIAKNLMKIDKRAKILFYCRSHFSKIIEEHGFKAIKSPPSYVQYQIKEPGENGKLELVFKGEKKTPLDNKTIIRRDFAGLVDTLLDFNPTVVIQDISPELTLLTKFLDYPIVYVCETFDLKKIPLRRKIPLENADLLLVPYTKKIYSLPRQYSRKAVYTGLISATELDKTPDKKHAKKIIGTDEKLIVVNAGSGLDGYQLFKTAIKAYPLIRKKVRVKMLIMEGIEFPKKFEAEIRKLAKKNGVIVKGFVPDILSYFRAADVVIGSTGYNMVTELCSVATPTIFLPLKRIHNEQLYKARKIKEMGLGYYSDLNSKNIAKKAIELLTNKKKYNKIVSNCKKIGINGGYKAAKAIYKFAKTCS